VKKLRGRVAVVTGAASGIGRALAERFAREKMKVVLADVEEPALAEATRALTKRGAKALGVPTDVSSAADVERLAAKARDAFGAVHVACNNAGVITGGTLWESPLVDYAWLLDVNVWGVINGIRTFVPILLEQEEGHLVNTASMAGLTSLPFSGIYHMTKHAVVALSECLYHELRVKGARVGVSLVCPEGVATRIDEASRNRPAEQRGPGAGGATPEGELVMKALAETVRRGVAPEVIAERTLAAIREDRFYVLPDDGWRRMAETRSEDVRLGRNPTLSVPQAEG
jgi:NAD(P)-dependent dehydrogenase (short-subunit alcohol dehydrogenase family)